MFPHQFSILITQQEVHRPGVLPMKSFSFLHLNYNPGTCDLDSSFTNSPESASGACVGSFLTWSSWWSHETNLYRSQFSSVQSLSRVRLFATPWIAACQASLSITNSLSLHKLMPIEVVMPSSHLILCFPLLLLPPIPPSIRVFSNDSTLHMRWPKYWSLSLSISPSNKHPGLISFRMDWLDLLGLSRVFSNTTVQKHQVFGAQLSSQSNSHIHTWPLEKP